MTRKFVQLLGTSAVAIGLAATPIAIGFHGLTSNSAYAAGSGSGAAGGGSGGGSGGSW